MLPQIMNCDRSYEAPGQSVAIEVFKHGKLLSDNRHGPIDRKLEAGRRPPRHNPFSLGERGLEASDSKRPLAEGPGRLFHSNSSCDPTRLRADHRRFAF